MKAARLVLLPALAIACADLTAPRTEASRKSAAGGNPAPAPQPAAAQPVQPATARPTATALPAPQGERIGAAHILVAYKGSRRANANVTRSKEEAKKRAQDLLVRAKKGQDFAELARKHSDGPSGPKGGDLGRFTRNAMVKPFADAAFALEPGQLAEVVETDFGFHVIKRTQ